jgi:hypothetical protein
MPLHSSKRFVAKVEQYFLRVHHQKMPESSWWVDRLTGRTEDEVELFMRQVYSLEGAAAEDKNTAFKKALQDRQADFQGYKTAFKDSKSSPAETKAIDGQLDVLVNQIYTSTPLLQVADVKEQARVREHLKGFLHAQAIWEIANPNKEYPRLFLHTKTQYYRIHQKSVKNKILTQMVEEAENELADLPKRLSFQQAVSVQKQKVIRDRKAADERRVELEKLKPSTPKEKKEPEVDHDNPLDLAESKQHVKEEKAPEVQNAEDEQQAHARVMAEAIHRKLTKLPVMTETQRLGTIDSIQRYLVQKEEYKKNLVVVEERARQKKLEREERKKQGLAEISRLDSKAPHSHVDDENKRPELSRAYSQAWSTFSEKSVLRAGEKRVPKKLVKPVVNAPDTVDFTELAPPPNLSNTVGRRGLNVFYWPDAVIGTACNLANRGFCFFANPVLDLCDAGVELSNTKSAVSGWSWYQEYPLKGICYLGKIAVGTPKLVWVGVFSAIEACTFAVGMAGSGNPGELLNLPSAVANSKGIERMGADIKSWWRWLTCQKQDPVDVYSADRNKGKADPEKAETVDEYREEVARDAMIRAHSRSRLNSVLRTNTGDKAPQQQSDTKDDTKPHSDLVINVHTSPVSHHVERRPSVSPNAVTSDDSLNLGSPTTPTGRKVTFSDSPQTSPVRPSGSPARSPEELERKRLAAIQARRASRNSKAPMAGIISGQVGFASPQQQQEEADSESRPEPTHTVARALV